MNNYNRIMIAEIIIYGIMLLHVSECAVSEKKKAIQQLQKHLMKNYTKDIPIDSDTGEYTAVSITLHAEKVLHVAPQYSYKSFGAHLCISWKDERLRWDPTKHSDLKNITFYRSDIWIPSLYVLESYWVSINFMHSLLKVTNTGAVLFCPRATFHMKCSMDLKDFPYDQHVCSVKIISMTRNDVEIPLVGLPIAKEEFQDDHPLWRGEILSFRKEEITHPEFPSEHVLAFSVRLTRKSSTYYFTLTLPMNVVCLLTLMIFWLPPSSGKKIVIGCINLVIIILILQVLRPDLGASVHVPKCVKQLGITFVTVGVASFIAIIVINMVKCPISFRPPGFLVNVFQGPVGSVLLLSTQVEKRPPTDHEKLVEETSFGDTQELAKRQEWFLLAQALDRIAFIIYVVILLVLRA